MNKLSVVITNYNTWDETIRCIEHIQSCDQHHVVDQIVVVNDASESFHDLSRDWLKVEQINNQVNKGYAACVNIGVNAASNDIVLLLDSDAYPVSDLGEVLMPFRKDAQLGVLGFKLVDAHGQETGSYDDEPTLSTLLLGQKLHAYAKKHILLSRSSAIVIHSCAVAFRKSVFELVHGFDESFDFLDADADFSMKVSRAGYAIKRTDQIVLFHVGGGSPQSTSKRVLRFYKNRYQLLQKYDKIKLKKMLILSIRLRVSIELFVIQYLLPFVKGKEFLFDKKKSRTEILKFLSGI
ncbi:MAG: glycosyltransferase family 2 protein [Cyclobacteriaceae bacterium]